MATESLESRELLTAIAWEDPDHLTASFAPDGTKIAGQVSTFNKSFAALGTPAQLQQWISEVFQTWSKSANVNIGIVKDGGQDFGSPGETQGDTRFGDVRIGAISMSKDALAVTIPHTGGVAGTWAGDIVFNTNFRPKSVAQFKAVAMHEIGHVLGLDHSTNSASPMYPRNSPTTLPTPAASDIAALKALHGNRTDPGEVAKTNDTLKTSTRMRESSYNGKVPLLRYGDISTTSDVDIYDLDKVDFYFGSVTVKFKTSGLSLLQGKLELLDKSGKVISTATSTGPGRDLSLTLPKLDKIVYVRVTGAPSQTAYRVGRYALVTTYDLINTVSSKRITEVLRRNVDFLRQSEIASLFRTGTSAVYFDDLRTNDTFATATKLKTAPGFVDNTHFEFFGTISNTKDVDYYSIDSPRTLVSGSVLSVTVDATEFRSLIPAVQVYDKAGKAMTARVLRNSNGTLTIQVAKVAAKSTYVVKVTSQRTNNYYQTGNYSFRARFTGAAEPQATLLGGTIKSTSPRQFHEMTLKTTTIFNFALETIRTAGETNPLLATQATLYDSKGREVHRIVSINDAISTSNSILLLPGKYFLRINTVSQNKAAFKGVAFRLLGSVISNPVGPIGTNPTQTLPTMPSATAMLGVTYAPPVYVPPPTIISLPTESPFVYQPPTPPMVLTLAPPVYKYQNWYWQFSMTSYTFP
jgi:hypothetical protein